MPTPNSDGPDISRYQTRTGPFDTRWRIGSAKASEGKNYGDRTFLGHYGWFTAGGARWVGGYHWLRSDSSMAAQAANFITRMNDATGSHSLPVGVMLQTDWETTPIIPLVTSDSVIEFNDRLRQHYGRDCVITYSSDWLPDSSLDADSRREFDEWRQARPDDPYWHANYNTGTSAQGGWAECGKYGADVWQWSSTQRHASIDNGAKGFDMNHIFNPATLDRICGYTDTIAPPEIIQPPKADLMNVIINVAGTDTVLIGQQDGNDLIFAAEWTGPGGEPLARDRLAFLRGKNAPVVEIGVDGLRLITLHGPIPYGDDQHVWTGAEFARVVN